MDFKLIFSSLKNLSPVFYWWKDLSFENCMISLGSHILINHRWNKSWKTFMDILLKNILLTITLNVNII